MFLFNVNVNEFELNNILKSFRFYICCDKCQDWFHGKCVGILQSEADFIDEYICPNCQKNNSVNFANMKSFGEQEFEKLFTFLKDIQVELLKLSSAIVIKFKLNRYRATRVHGHFWIQSMQVKFLIITMSLKNQWVNYL